MSVKEHLSSLPTLSTCATEQLGNQLLLALQCPNATIVGGFRQWKMQGRCVKRGEHGHMIWVPMIHGSAEGESDTPQPSDLDGATEGKPERLRFLVGTVFDISQTSESSEREVTYADAE